MKGLKNYTDFRKTLSAKSPSAAWTQSLQALWWDARGDWEASHKIAQDIDSPEGNGIHAYLHRKEGDEWNARYWYRQAGKNYPEHSLEVEFRELVEGIIEGR